MRKVLRSAFALLITLAFSAMLVLALGGSYLISSTQEFGRVTLKEGGLFDGRVLVETRVYGNQELLSLHWKWCPDVGLTSWCVSLKNDKLSADGYLEAGLNSAVLSETMVDLTADLSRSYGAKFAGVLFIEEAQLSYDSVLPETISARGRLENFSFQDAEFGEVEFRAEGALADAISFNFRNRYIEGSTIVLSQERVEQRLTYLQQHSSAQGILRLLGLNSAGDEMVESFDIDGLLAFWMGGPVR